jgi:hypothetical protein
MKCKTPHNCHEHGGCREDGFECIRVGHLVLIHDVDDKNLNLCRSCGPKNCNFEAGEFINNYTI